MDKNIDSLQGSIQMAHNQVYYSLPLKKMERIRLSQHYFQKTLTFTALIKTPGSSWGLMKLKNQQKKEVRFLSLKLRKKLKSLQKVHGRIDTLQTLQETQCLAKRGMIFPQKKNSIKIIQMFEIKQILLRQNKLSLVQNICQN